MTIWGVGNFIVIFLAGLQNVPKTYLEAVEIDGGNAWHKFRHVTLPLMLPIIFFNFLMSMVANLQVFVPAYALTKRGAEQLDPVHGLPTSSAKGSRGTTSAMPAALSLIFFVFIAAVTAVIFATSRKWMFYEGE